MSSPLDPPREQEECIHCGHPLATLRHIEGNRYECWSCNYTVIRDWTAEDGWRDAEGPFLAPDGSAVEVPVGWDGKDGGTEWW